MPKLHGLALVVRVDLQPGRLADPLLAAGAAARALLPLSARRGTVRVRLWVSGPGTGPEELIGCSKPQLKSSHDLPVGHLARRVAGCARSQLNTTHRAPDGHAVAIPLIVCTLA